MKKIKVTVKNSEPITISANTTLFEFAKEYQQSQYFNNPILLAKVDNDLHELHKPLTKDCNIEFLDITDVNGFRAYQRSTAFLMIYAFKAVCGKKTRVVIKHSINKNYYCEIQRNSTDSKVDISKDVLNKVENKMHEMVLENLPIEKLSLPIEEAVSISEKMGLEDKVQILKYRRTASVNFYKLGWFYDYFYGVMVPNTGCLTKFKLNKDREGFMLQFPNYYNPQEFSKLRSVEKISNIFMESASWAKILKVDTVVALNNIICDKGIGDIIKISEALHEKKIANIADLIYQGKKSLVLIAGPSSSGKTTFAERLCIQLRVNGLKPKLISIDDYYVDRLKAPLDSDGKPDLESINSIDVKQINEDMKKLIIGERVQIPKYNFGTGKREYKGRFIELNKGDVLVLEGIHGLNEILTSDVAKRYKFKIFISALTQVNIDDHNRIPTTDTRLIRRIVRDNRFRGTDADETIDMWPSVLRGENSNIFPYQEEADVFFNSALVYEMCVLKQFAEALLFKIPKSQKQYAEARRLVKFLDSFIGVDSEQIPPNSILREFIGGSCFNT